MRCDVVVPLDRRLTRRDANEATNKDAKTKTLSFEMARSVLYNLKYSNVESTYGDVESTEQIAASSQQSLVAFAPPSMLRPIIFPSHRFLVDLSASLDFFVPLIISTTSIDKGVAPMS